jgi:hypothetical protein
MYKVEMHWTLVLLNQTASQVINMKESSWGKLKVPLQWAHKL